MPQYAAFDPIEFPWALGFLSVVSILQDGNYRYRIDGTRVVEFFGVEMGGKLLSDYPFPQRKQRIKESFELVRNAKAPVKIERNVFVEEKSLRMHLLLLPFSNDGKDVSEIMSCLAYGADLAAPISKTP
jgi:hypothetical protein